MVCWLYNLTICSLKSRLQHIYNGRPYARVDLNPMRESTDFPPQSGALDLPSEVTRPACGYPLLLPPPPPTNPLWLYDIFLFKSLIFLLFKPFLWKKILAKLLHLHFCICQRFSSPILQCRKNVRYFSSALIKAVPQLSKADFKL